MVDINAFLTQQTAQGATKASSAQVPKGGTGIFASGAAGLSFMDLIFARLTAEGQKGEGVGVDISGEGGTATDGTTLNLETGAEPLNLDQIVQETLNTGTDDAAKIADLQEVLGSVSEKIRDKITAILERKLQGLPQETKVEGLSLGQIKQALNKLSGTIETDQEGTPVLIATGVTPEELTNIINELTDGNESGEAFNIVITQVLPPETKERVVFLPRGAVATQPKHPAGELTAQQQQTDQNTAAKLNALTVGDGAAEDGAPLFEEDDFEGVLRMLERAQTKGVKAGQQADKGIENAIKNIRQQISAGLSTTQGTPPALTEMFTSFAVDSIFPDGWDFSAGSANSLNFNSPAQLTSMISHVQQAGMPHPATQMVASVIAKATTNGETRNISIQLDPPDLGRVSINLEFNKEKNTVKAILTAEKPETHLMMQRDAQVLERALQEAGLDADGSSLEFQLSQDGNMFEQDEHSTGGNSGGGSDNAEGEEEMIEIIETTMDWYVDPETGAMRYDALV